MKLTELIFAAVPMPDKDLSDQAWFDGDAVSKVEGNFTLFKKDQVFYLRSDSGDLAGYIDLENDVVKTIYILPGFRKLGLGLSLLHSVKQLLGKVVFADVMSTDGAALIDRMIKYPHLFSLSVELDGEVFPYDPQLIQKTQARLIIEGKIGADPLVGLSWPSVPGNVNVLSRDGIVWFAGESE